MLTYKGIYFDDWDNSEPEAYWVEICDECYQNVERRIVSGTNDELFSGVLPFMATQIERSDRCYAV